MVAGDIVFSASMTKGGRSPYSCIYPGSHKGNTAFNLFEQGRLADNHIFFSGFSIAFLL
jgi:hypothetical protein